MWQHRSLWNLSWMTVVIIIIIIIMSKLRTVMSDQLDCLFNLDRNCTCSYQQKITLDNVLLSSNRCEWFLNSYPGRFVLTRVENVHVGEHLSSLEIIVDDSVNQIKGNCDNCLSDLSGKSLRVIWNKNSNNNSNATSDYHKSFSNATFDFPAKSSHQSMFTIIVAVFQPAYCTVATDLVNAYVESDTTSNIIPVGDSIHYRCVDFNDLHLAEDDVQSVDAACTVSFDNLESPVWSKLPPVCQNLTFCNNTVKIAARHDRSQLVYFNGSFKDKSCVFEMSSTDGSNFVQFALESFTINQAPASSQLLWYASMGIYDGDIDPERRLSHVNIGSAHFRNFISLHRKIIVVLTNNVGGFANVTFSFRAYVSAIMSSCGLPTYPSNGGVRGVELNQSLVPSAVFYCDSGYRLVGNDHAECVGNGVWSPVPGTCYPTTVVVGGVHSKDKTGLTKSSQLRPDELSRSHPQNIEDKNGKKILTKETFDVMKFSKDYEPVTVNETDHILQNVSDDDTVPNYSGDLEPFPRFSDGSLDYTEIMSGFSNIDAYDLDGDDADGESDILEADEITKSSEMTGFPILAIIIGVTLPLLICTVVLVSCMVYRKLYPVRMGPGRKFETFENPVYDRTKRRLAEKCGGNAHCPTELERLTVHTSP